MNRIAPEPPIEVEGAVIKPSILPAHLGKQVTDTDSLFVLAHLAVPRVERETWSLEICGLVERPRSISFDELMAYRQDTLESVLQCAGNPFDPTTPTRQVANLLWRGVDVRQLLRDVGIDSSATHLWAYGLEPGSFAGTAVAHYLKDVPLSRVEQGDVLIAHELNGAPLSAEHGYPARLVVPGFYGTNSVKWICRLELADRRATGLFTTELYNEPCEDGSTRPVWALEPESMFVFPEPDVRLSVAPKRVWGRAWSSAEIASVEVSFDGGERWADAAVTPRHQRGWQTFSIDWHPPAPGHYRLQCRATEIDGRVQPATGARNAIYTADVVVVTSDDRDGPQV